MVESTRSFVLVKGSDNLVQHLLSIGGREMFGDQIYHDPDCKLIFDSGRVFSATIKRLIPMDDHWCHWNISSLYKQSLLTEIVIGYALNYHGQWFQHTWGMQEETLVETTEINYNNIRLYFGAILDDPCSFVEWCEQNLPGSGRVRRTYE
jgi:hypothetical protein